MSGFTKDTSILIKQKEKVDFYPISKPPGLFNVYIEDSEKEMILFRSNHSFQKDKDIFQAMVFPYHFVPTQDLFVWSNEGFIKIQKIIKQFHPVPNKIYYCPNKSLYQITTESGEISITENFYLSTQDNQPIYPKEMKIGTLLLHTDMPKDISKPLDENKTLKHQGETITKIVITPFFCDFVYRLETEKTENKYFSAGNGRILVPEQSWSNRP